MRSLTLEFFKQLHGLPRKSSFYALQNDELSERDAVQQFCSTAPALPFVFATLRNKTGHHLHIERAAVSHAKIVLLDDEKSSVRGEAST